MKLIVIILISIINPQSHCIENRINCDVFELLIAFCFFPDTLHRFERSSWFWIVKNSQNNLWANFMITRNRPSDCWVSTATFQFVFVSLGQHHFERCWGVQLSRSPHDDWTPRDIAPLSTSRSMHLFVQCLTAG